MATQGDLLRWRINMKHFWLGKNIEIYSLDKTKPYPTHASCGSRAHDLLVTQWWLSHLGQPTTLTTWPPRTICIVYVLRF